MGIFLQILGGLCLGLVVLVFLLILAAKLFRRKLLQTLESVRDQALASYVPPRVHLEPQTSVEWKDAEKARGLISEIRDLRFEEAGVYTVAEIPPLRIHALVHPADHVYAVVYEHDQAGVWIDYVTSYEDHGGATHSTGARGHVFEARPGQQTVYAPETPAATLYQLHLSERRAHGITLVTAADFPKEFEGAYARAMDWRNSRGGPTEDEIRRELAASGEEATDEQIAQVRAAQVEQAISGLQVALAERFLAETTMSAARWEQVEDRLTYIFDLLPAPRSPSTPSTSRGMRKTSRTSSPSRPTWPASPPAKRSHASTSGFPQTAASRRSPRWRSRFRRTFTSRRSIWTSSGLP